MGKEKKNINVVVIGHVDAGKSTTTGHLLLQCGAIDARVLQKLETASADAGKASFKFAWVLDTGAAERERGVTINTSVRKFESKNLKYTIIDAPGHRDFLKNMITGATQADVSLLMVTAAKGEFEAGWGAEGQTKEHALLAFTMGVKQMIVCINKMDNPTVEYSRQRFEEIKAEVGKYLVKCGFKLPNVPFVPISGWKGDNLVERSDKMAWYTGPTLLEALDALEPPKRPTDTPLRVPLENVYKIQGVGTVAVGRVETGVLKAGMDICFAPAGVKGKVGSIEMHHQQLEEAGPGLNVGFNVRGVSHDQLRRGDVAGRPDQDAPEEAVSFEAQVIVMQNVKALRPGYTPVLDCGTAHVACRFEELLAVLDKKTGRVVEEKPDCLKPGQAALVRLVPTKPMVVEPFNLYHALGRFAVRDGNRTVAVGVVKRVLRKVSGLVGVPDTEVAAKPGISKGKGKQKKGAKKGSKKGAKKTVSPKKLQEAEASEAEASGHEVAPAA